MSQPDTELLLNVEQMIKNHLADLARLREQIKSQKEMFNQSFEQDKEFSEVAEQHKEMKRKHQAAKEKIIKTDAVSVVKSKIGELQDEMKDIQRALSDYLNQYVQLTNAADFTGPDGEVLTIVRSAKLVKKK